MFASESSALNSGHLWWQFRPCVTRRTLCPPTAHEIGTCMVTSMSPGCHHIHGGPLARSLGTFVPCPSPSPWGLRPVGGFPTRRRRCPLCLPARPWTLRCGSPLPPSTVLRIPCRLSRVHPVGLHQDGGGGTCLVAPSTLCGFPVPAEGQQVHLCHLRQHRSCLLPRPLLPRQAVSSVTGSPVREGMRGAALPVGLGVLQGMHQPLSSPHTTSWVLTCPS